MKMLQVYCPIRTAPAFDSSHWQIPQGCFPSSEGCVSGIAALELSSRDNLEAHTHRTNSAPSFIALPLIGYGFVDIINTAWIWLHIHKLETDSCHGGGVVKFYRGGQSNFVRLNGLNIYCSHNIVRDAGQRRRILGFLVCVPHYNERERSNTYTSRQRRGTRCPTNNRLYALAVIPKYAERRADCGAN